MASEFKRKYVARLRSDWWRLQADNFDPHRFPAGPRGDSRWRWLALRLGGERARSMLRIARTLRAAPQLRLLYEALSAET